LLGIVVVNWNDVERSLQCMRSALAVARPDLLPVLVDNHSVQDPTERLREELPEVEVLRLVSNRGYAGGVNAGVGWAIEHGADHVLVLNNDTTLEDTTLDSLLSASSDHPGAILGPKIVYAHQPSRVWFAGGRLSRPWMKSEHIGEDEDSYQHRVDRKCEWTTGCALFASVETFRRVGPLDENYFLYLEDTDWCLRAQRLGVETWFVARAVVHHDVSSTVEKLPAAYTRYYAYRNYYRLVFRNGRWRNLPTYAFDLTWTVVKIFVRWLFFRSYRNDRYYHARTLAVRDFLLGRWGEAPRSLLISHPEPAAAAGMQP
jgi:GT2 family glycosyltransferase